MKLGLGLHKCLEELGTEVNWLSTQETEQKSLLSVETTK